MSDTKNDEEVLNALQRTVLILLSAAAQDAEERCRTELGDDDWDRWWDLGYAEATDALHDLVGPTESNKEDE